MPPSYYTVEIPMNLSIIRIRSYPKPLVRTIFVYMEDDDSDEISICSCADDPDDCEFTDFCSFLKDGRDCHDYFIKSKTQFRDRTYIHKNSEDTFNFLWSLSFLNLTQMAQLKTILPNVIITPRYDYYTPDIYSL